MTAFDRAWALMKMPIHMDSDDELNISHPLSVHGPVYQGRRAGNPDTGHWTPHKDKALAYALFGPRYDWGSQNYVDARTEIPELWQYELGPDQHGFVPADSDYTDIGNLHRGLADRRIAFKDEYGDIASGEFGADLENEGVTPSKVPDNELADIIERLLQNKNFAESIGKPYESNDLTNYEGLMDIGQLDTIFEPDEYERIFGVAPDKWDNIGINPDHVEYEDLDEILADAYSDDIEMDTSVVTGMKGGHLTDIIDSLRRRGQ